jgi:hypothetical protein
MSAVCLRSLQQCVGALRGTAVRYASASPGQSTSAGAQSTKKGCWVTWCGSMSCPAEPHELHEDDTDRIQRMCAAMRCVIARRAASASGRRRWLLGHQRLLLQHLQSEEDDDAAQLSVVEEGRLFPDAHKRRINWLLSETSAEQTPAENVTEAVAKLSQQQPLPE